MDVLIIGGTRFVGRRLALDLLERGHRVTTFNRGLTPDELPAEVERLRGDRRLAGALARAVGKRSFDAAVDMIAMRGSESQDAIATLDGKVGHFVHVSTGQVYLVREDARRPAREEDYDGPLRPAPPADAWDHREWRYGVEKRECEDRLAAAWTERGFPATRIRIPIVNGPEDYHGRIEGYVRRLIDGGPILVPEEPSPPLRHVWAPDVARAIARIVETGAGRGRAYNMAQDDLWSFAMFLGWLGDLVGKGPRIARFPRARLVAAGVFPGCSPFSNPWMSVLDNARAKSELGFAFTGYDGYLPGLVDLYREPGRAPAEEYFAGRPRELALAG